MIQPVYEVYKKTAAGKRGTLVEGIIEMDMLFRKNEPAKWTFTGAGLGEPDLSEADEIIVFRNGEAVLSGFVCKAVVEYDAATRIFDWSVEGYSDLGKLAHRLTWPNPQMETPVFGYEYKDEDYFSDVLLKISRVNAALQAQSARRIANLDIDTLPHYGDTVTIGADYDELLSYIQKKMEDSTMCIRSTWSGSTGKWGVEIYNPRDVSDKVIFSVESGSISYWKRTTIAPAGNWIIVKGVTRTDTNKIMSVIVSDADSIAKWGRIELTVNRTDIDQIVETNDSGTVTYTEPWSSVADRLQAAAYEELENNSAQIGYEITVLDIDRFSYKSDWDLSDWVSVRIGSDEFKAQIEEVKVNYAAGVETVTPSIGALQKGELMTVFDELGRLKAQVNILQKEN